MRSLLLATATMFAITGGAALAATGGAGAGTTGAANAANTQSSTAAGAANNSAAMTSGRGGTPVHPAMPGMVTTTPSYGISTNATTTPAVPNPPPASPSQPADSNTLTPGTATSAPQP